MSDLRTYPGCLASVTVRAYRANLMKSLITKLQRALRLTAREHRTTFRAGPLTRFQRLERAEGISSPNGKVLLHFDAAGTLHLTQDGSVIWSSPVSVACSYLLLEGNGTLSLWTERSRVWTAGGATGTELAVQDDGNLVLYDGRRAAWALR